MLKYKNKYKKILKHARELVFINASICDEVSNTEDQIFQLKEERRYLLNKLLSYKSGYNKNVISLLNSNTNDETSLNSSSYKANVMIKKRFKYDKYLGTNFKSSKSNISDSIYNSNESEDNESNCKNINYFNSVDNNIVENTNLENQMYNEIYTKNNINNNDNSNSLNTSHVNETQSIDALNHEPPILLSNLNIKKQNLIQGPSNISTHYLENDIKKNISQKRGYSEKCVNQKNDFDKMNSMNDKERKFSKMVFEKRLTKLDASNNSNRLSFPILLSNLTVYSLGNIKASENYHCHSCIYPVGFYSKRKYISISSLDAKTFYICKILENGNKPKFEIIIDSMPCESFEGSSPSECHTNLIEAINISRGINISVQDTSGNEFFGLTHPSIKNYIQNLPGSHGCKNYNWINCDVLKNEIEMHFEKDQSVNISLFI